MALSVWSEIRFPLVGMLHLPPLPGSPQFRDSLSAIETHALRDAETLAAAGFDGLMLENFGDAPFFPDRVPAVTVAAMTRIAAAVRGRFSLPLGINVLRNDGRSALAIAVATGCSFIRVNILCGARVTDQGVIQGIAHDLLRERAALGTSQIALWADVHVKHSAPLADRPVGEEAIETLERGGADAVIVTGTATGVVADYERLREVKAAIGPRPLLVGSGVTAENLPTLAKLANGAIVGSSLKAGDDVRQPVDAGRAAAVHASRLPL
jgi:membrane complex biogenesis BtpA family protein